MARDRRPPVRPGETRLAELLLPVGITNCRLARDVSVPPRRINEIVHGKRAISADTAPRLARYSGTTAQFRLNLQIRFDPGVERDRLASRLGKEIAVQREAV